MQGTIHEHVKFVRALKPDAHTVGAKNGDVIDLKGFDEAAFFLDLGTLGTSVDMKLQEGAKADGSDMADVTGATITQLVAGDKQAILSVKKADRKRYVRVVVTMGGTEDCAVMAALCKYQYPPVTQAAAETKRV